MIDYMLNSMSITIDDLRNNRDKSYKFLLNNSYHIETQYKDVLFYFLGKEIEENPSNMGDYTICPEWGDASSDFRMRFIIVKSDNDYSLVVLKVVTPFTENYLRIDYPIVSIYRNETSSKVLRVLKMYKGIHFYSVISENKDGRRYNYYNTLEDFESKMNKSKWKSKKGINKLSKIIDVKCNPEIIGLDYIKQSIKHLVKEWDKAKSSKTAVSTDLKLVDIYKKSNDINIITFWYKDIMVGYSLEVDMFNYAMLLSTKTISVCDDEQVRNILNNECSDEDIHNIIKHLGAYTQYHLHRILLKEMRYDAVFYYGDVGIKGLHSFKEEYYKNRIDYKYISMEDYNEH